MKQEGEKRNLPSGFGCLMKGLWGLMTQFKKVKCPACGEQNPPGTLFCGGGKL